MTEAKGLLALADAVILAGEKAQPVTLLDCPIGLFLCGDELCLKTEYGNNEGRIDAYIVSSGEFFWGDAPQTIASQRAQIVTPVEYDRTAAPALALAYKEAVAKLDKACELLASLVGSVDNLIGDSEGVYGLHLNGDPAPWSELTEGGRFEEWLIALEPARAFLKGE